MRKSFLSLILIVQAGMAMNAVAWDGESQALNLSCITEPAVPGEFLKRDCQKEREPEIVPIPDPFPTPSSTMPWLMNHEGGPKSDRGDRGNSGRSGGEAGGSSGVN